MKFTDFFNITGETHSIERSCSTTVRLFGLDIDLSLYANYRDWVFPILVIPSWTMRGIAIQVLFVAIFIGRLPGDE